MQTLCEELTRLSFVWGASGLIGSQPLPEYERQARFRAAAMYSLCKFAAVYADPERQEDGYLLGDVPVLTHAYEAGKLLQTMQKVCRKYLMLLDALNEDIITEWEQHVADSESLLESSKEFFAELDGQQCGYDWLKRDFKLPA
jgi:hypothetical protein